MQAIKVQIYFSEWEKVSDFISEINIDEEWRLTLLITELW